MASIEGHVEVHVDADDAQAHETVAGVLERHAEAILRDIADAGYRVEGWLHHHVGIRHAITAPGPAGTAAPAETADKTPPG
jgi:hypothetical protein